MLRANRSTRRSSGSNTQLGDSGTNRISLTRFTSTAGVSIWLLRPLNIRKLLLFRSKWKQGFATWHDSRLECDAVVGAGAAGFDIGFRHLRISCSSQHLFHLLVEGELPVVRLNNYDGASLQGCGIVQSISIPRRFPPLRLVTPQASRPQSQRCGRKHVHSVRSLGVSLAPWVWMSGGKH